MTMHRTTPRILAAWAVLLVMALVVTPRLVWHDCTDLHGAEQAHGTAEASVKAVCAICAVPVLVASDPIAVLVAFETSTCAVQPALQDCSPVLGNVQRAADRGPPEVA